MFHKVFVGGHVYGTRLHHRGNQPGNISFFILELKVKLPVEGFSIKVVLEEEASFRSHKHEVIPMSTPKHKRLVGLGKNTETRYTGNAHPPVGNEGNGVIRETGVAE